MPPSDETSLEARLEKGLRRTFPIYDFVGIEVQSAREGVYRCFVPFRPENLNHIATIHAAIQWAASEGLGGLVMMSALVSLVLWGLAVGLDVDVVKKISEKLDVIDVKEEPPPPPEEL